MKHARKMVLVDYDKHMSTNKPIHELDTAPKPLYALQSQMDQVLNDNKLSDYEKQNLYLRKLNKFLYLNQLNRKQNENKLIPDVAIPQIQNDTFEIPKFKPVKRKREPSSSESDDSDTYVSTHEDSFIRTLQEKVKQGAIPKTPKQSTPKKPTTKQPTSKNNDQSGSPYEIYRQLRNRDVILTKKKLLNLTKSKWNSFEDINKTLKKK
jgi:hypothetical protein